MNTQLIKIAIVFFMVVSETAIATTQAGKVVGRNVFGLAMDYQFDPVMLNQRPLIYDKVYDMALVEKEQQRFQISSFHHDIGNLYLTRLDQQDQAIDSIALDLSPIGGVSKPGNVTLSPWGTLLITSNNTFNTARPGEFISNFKPYYKNKSDLINPYDYGYVLEYVLLNASGDSKVIKNYAIGRVMADSLVMMPDGKTLYMLDNDTSGHLYVFVSDDVNSFSSGTLYAVNGQGASIGFTELGQGSALRMKFKLKKISFDSIFESVQPGDRSCPEGFSFIQSHHGTECLKIRKRNRRYAGLLEPVRTAAINQVKPFSPGSKSLAFDPQKNQLVLKDNNGVNRQLILGRNEKLNSDYVIQE